jgi:serine/threonine protein kinase
MHWLGAGGPPEHVPGIAPLELSYDEIVSGDVIGQGGNADVFRTTVTREGRDIEVAVKQPRLQGTLHAETVQRFVEEADVWERLDDHDHVVGLYDWGTDPVPWIAMEYMDGGSLGAIHSDGTLPLEQAVWVGLCVCRAIHYAHRHGIAHHDIKPTNVLFTEPQEGWLVPKVSDWGLAQLMFEETGSIEGLSPHYAAPEQFDAERFGSPDDRTDIYQVGTLVYELVTGRPPFDGTSTEVMQGFLSKEPVPPSDAADVPDVFDDILLPALQKQPADRYDSVLYLRDELSEYFESSRSSSTDSDAIDSGSTSYEIGENSTDQEQKDRTKSDSEAAETKQPQQTTTAQEEQITEAETGDTIALTRQQPVLLGFMFVVYPVLLFGALLPQFPPAVNLTAAACAMLMIAFLQKVPKVGIAVFGIWSVFMPLTLVFLDVDLISVRGFFAILAVVFPFGLSLLTRVAIQPGSAAP